ncbi:shikimate kinase [bacterium 210820-DFI.6.37]|nr:shikimate kinase [bacterium 210820-DFI.6.37]
MPNIVLIGMPACGKSVTGVVLAKTLQKGFVDTDLLIQERERRALQTIIDIEGMQYFKETEEQVLRELKETDAVVSTGGSAVYYPKAMEYLKERGVIVYLEVSLETVEKRLNNIKTRGVAMGKDDTIEKLYRQRIPLYERYADITIKADELEVEETVAQIKEALQNRR